MARRTAAFFEFLKIFYSPPMTGCVGGGVVQFNLLTLVEQSAVAERSLKLLADNQVNVN